MTSDCPREFFLANLWRWAAGVPEISAERLPGLDALRASEWSPEFERFMRNRLIMGAFRYGVIVKARRSGYRRICDIERRILEYRRTGNAELLVDVANQALLEFVETGGRFSAADDGCHMQDKGER